MPVGQHYLVSRLMKGIYNSRPRTISLYPKWDVSTVLSTIKSWGPNDKLDLKLLTYKTCFLLAVVCAKRPSTLSMLSVDPTVFQLSDGIVRMLPVGIEKHSRPEFKQTPIVIRKFDDILLDPVGIMKIYLEKTKYNRVDNSLFLSPNPPYPKASPQMISKFVSSVISLSGQTGTGGSTRSVAASTAFNKGVSLDKIMEAGDWTRVSTFKTFYYKPQLPLSNAILNTS